ncbi:MAG: hypothetical protein HGB12_05515 [Bacteroidetes bacterium]|nr:hypothetical protein [Bacteroidota bacterium]
MKKTEKYNKQKRTYNKPEIKIIKIDNEISMVMMSPLGNPNESIDPGHFCLNPFKIDKF